MAEPTASRRNILYVFILLAAIIVIVLVINLFRQASERMAEPTVFGVRYEDGTYRGIYADTDEIQVSLQFTLQDGVVTDASFRHLRRDDNYYLGTEEEPYRSVIQQYQESLQYLVGRNLVETLPELYEPENTVETQVDGYTAATIRSSKIISAIRDALNRGVYRY